ncbi:F-box domain-containing protein [Favolaschia claudopus]|uniref:F-box domain-containing protein n=1 Tax=Favolaschia claudopus TaxID=2862362 RepID=A0AAW0D1W2_9AGAR
MASATAHRTVWFDALRRVCVAQEVSILTFPMENMSLRDLEHAATSPARFIAHLSKQRETEEIIPALSTRIFQPRLPRPLTGISGDISRMRLIPGGRYLVTTSNLARMSVWDLGHRPAAIIKPYPLVSIVLSFQPSELLIQPTEDHSGFRILTISVATNANLVDVTVYEIYPATEDPTLRQIANQSIFASNLRVYALTRNRFTYYYNFLLTTWDFVENTAGIVHIYQPLWSITVAPTTVIGHCDDGIVMVEVPPLHPVGTPAAGVVAEPVSPSPMVSHTHDVFAEFIDVHMAPTDWHTSPSIPLVMDVFGRLEDSTPAYARSLLHEIPGGGHPDLPSAFPILMGISRVPYETFDADFCGRLHLANTHLFRTWATSPTELMINMARVPFRRQIEFESKTAYLWGLPNNVQGFLYDLDPMSGRFVSWTTSDIRVVDFLLPHF